MYIFLKGVFLYKYVLLVRVICEKYQLRGEANFTSRLETLTNRTYLFNSAEYLTASRTVACKKNNANKFEIYTFFQVKN
jgi:hypothetical protein